MNTSTHLRHPDERQVAATGEVEDDLFDDSDFWEGFVESVSVIARRRIPGVPSDGALLTTRIHL
jgi:hypothetical protein